MSQEHAVSATQIERGSGCFRSLGWRYIAGVKEPDTRENTFGTELHGVAEDYLNKGKKPDLETKAGRRFFPALRFLPPPGVGGVEDEYDLTISGVAYGVKIDWIGPAVLVPDCPPECMSWPAVIDHKTSKNPKEYGLKEREDFLANPQAVLYMAAALVKNPTAGGVYARWIYYASPDGGNPDANARSHAFTREEITEAFKWHVHAWGVEIVKIRSKPRHPLAIVPNPAWCHHFKTRSPKKKPGDPGYNPGCYYQPLCTDVTDEDKDFAQLEEKDNMDLLALVKAEAANPPPDPINPPVPAVVLAQHAAANPTAPIAQANTDLLASLQAVPGVALAPKVAPSAPAAAPVAGGSTDLLAQLQSSAPAAVALPGTPANEAAIAAHARAIKERVDAATQETVDLLADLSKTAAPGPKTSAPLIPGPSAPATPTPATGGVSTPTSAETIREAKNDARSKLSASVSVTSGVAMPMRDAFALKAMEILIPAAFHSPEQIADAAYRMADAMMLRREEQPT